PRPASVAVVAASPLFAGPLAAGLHAATITSGHAAPRSTLPTSPIPPILMRDCLALPPPGRNPPAQPRPPAVPSPPHAPHPRPPLSRVALDELAEARHRGLHVLLRLSSKLLVRALDQAAVRRASPPVGDGEQRVGDPSRVRHEVRAHRLALRLR